MSFYPSLPDSHHLVQLWRRFPKGIAPLLALHDDLLRQDDSALTIAERELIAAHVSALNGCRYCFVAHRRYAEAFGIDAAAFGDMAVHTSHASLRPEMTSALAYSAKLTKDPSSVVQADFDGLLSAGWDEDAIHDIVAVTALYGFMNRLLEGSGMKENVAAAGFTPDKARAGRYSDLLALINGA